MMYADLPVGFWISVTKQGRPGSMPLWHCRVQSDRTNTLYCKRAAPDPCELVAHTVGKWREENIDQLIEER
jgi:hypothetical protein